MMERKPRAPVLRSIALRAIDVSASSANASSMFSIRGSRGPPDPNVALEAGMGRADPAV